MAVNNSLLLCVYRKSDQFEVGYRLVGHTDSVTAADAVYVDRQLLIVSASADCSLRIWWRSEDKAGKILLQVPNI